MDLKGIEGISKFTFTDYPKFSKNFKEEKAKYSSSWLYTLRSARDDAGDLSHKFLHGNLLFTISKRKGIIYIGKPFGLSEDNIDEFLKVIDRLRKSNKEPILIKKLTQEFIDKIRNEFECRDISKANSSLYEDEAYPEKIVDLNSLFEPKYKQITKSKPLRKGVNRYKNNNGAYDMECLSNEDKINADLFFRVLEKVSRKNLEKKLAFTPLINYITSRKNINCRIILRIYHIENEYHGLYLLEKLSADSLGFYCGLTSIKYPGVTEYLDYLVLKEAFRNGYRWVNFGGSETEGVYRYNRKFKPLEPDYIELPLLIK